jgi:23S rRNA pseudouridine1911/1915/1917 synthase
LTDQVASQAATSKAARRKADPERLRLGRNFLHAARLEFTHPRTGKLLELEAPLPRELVEFLALVEDGQPAPAKKAPQSGRAERKRLIK